MDAEPISVHLLAILSWASEEPLRAGGIVGLTVVLGYALTRAFKSDPLSHIPIVGPKSYVGSYIYALKHAVRMQPAIREGYLKYGGRPFRIPTLYGWQVVLASPDLLKEVGRAPDDSLSFFEAANQDFKLEHTMAHRSHHTHLHVPVIQNRLTRNLARLFTDIREEIVAAFNDGLGLQGNDWKAIPAHDMAANVVARTSNRVFVGLPYCRDPEYIDLCIRFTLDIAKAAITIKLFPKILSPLVARYLTNAHNNLQHAHKLLGPMIEERLRLEAELGDEWTEKPNDLLSWCIDESKGIERTPYEIARRILVINFAAIHTSSNNFCQALFNIAAYPSYVPALREEVSRIVTAEGWTKAAMGKMVKLESFLAETMRLEGLNILTMQRKAMHDITLSDGTFVPVGTVVAVAADVRHLDPALHGDEPETFDPWRFLKHDGPSPADGVEGEEGEDKVQNRVVSVNEDWLVFGYGRHACPGRFFVVNELKAMLAHVLVTYDVKLMDDARGERPASFVLGASRAANQTAKVMFRKRAD
ncbi:cytochrome P450 [Coniophora puteana RWD-64-598 SS2]|uniref:Cytochrome P450 n=1 Tax=Coniophora puteana (strain RWD-64-598) TaxID=741705 RepID=A0A5M3MWR4_CONPW|nr:cytochrome P450 [Coniophora puteana RWD-64-598 SS2]EIW83582.1 cytochrome P450 [Coniophora puteana RWD-64-598 SS2]